MNRPRNLYQALTLLNTVLLVGCVIFLVFGKKDPTSNIATGQGVTPDTTSGSYKERTREKPPKNQRVPQGIEEQFEDIAEPIKRAALDHQADPRIYLPSEEELAAAIATGSLNSAESLVVLEKFKKGYAQYNMPFPSFREPFDPDASPTEQANPDAQAVRQWISAAIQILSDEANTKEIPVQDLLPTSEEQEAAARSASFDSKEFLLVLEILEKGYQTCKLNLPAPPRSSSTSSPSSMASVADSEPVSANAAERQIINAYFQGQTQRIQLEAEKKSIDVSNCLPTEEDVQKASRSESISSEDSLAALKKIEACYLLLELPFYPPVQR